jgi:hypothetical protein
MNFNILNSNNLILLLTLFINSYIVFELRNINQNLLVRLSDFENNLSLVSKEVTSLKHQIIVERMQGKIAFLEKASSSSNSTSDFYSCVPSINSFIVVGVFVLSILVYLNFPYIVAKMGTVGTWGPSTAVISSNIPTIPPVMSAQVATTSQQLVIREQPISTASDLTQQLVIREQPISTASDLTQQLVIGEQPISTASDLTFIEPLLTLTVSDTVDSAGRFCEVIPEVVKFAEFFLSGV